MSNERSWEIISSINWDETHSNPIEATKRKLLDSFTKNDLREVRNFYGDLWSALSSVIEQYEDKSGRHCGQYGGDDSYGDMISHAISRGKEYYEAVLADPKLLNSLDFVECFSYVLPYDDDYAQYNNEHHRIRAGVAISALVGIDAVELIQPSQRIYKELMARFTFMKLGDFAAATKGMGDNPGPQGHNVKLYDKYYEWEGNPAHALFSNVLSDCYQKIVKEVE